MGGIQMSWNKKHIKGLQATGKIRGFIDNDNAVREPSRSRGKKGNVIPKASKEKAWMGWNLMHWANENALELKTEYKFSDDRKFRFDWAFPAVKIAIEYEGLNSYKSGHTTMSGFTSNTDKYNLAQAQGWIVLRFTLLNYKSLPKQLNDAFNNGNRG